MRALVHLGRVLFTLGAFASCTSPTDSAGRAYVTAYYDGNRDGMVDYELHDLPHTADDAWALRDRDFDGRYDVRYVFGVVGTRSPVDQPVPRSVRITPGDPAADIRF